MTNYNEPGRSTGALFHLPVHLLNLHPGEAIFQGPRVYRHAYLEGQNVEIMANSDNVREDIHTTNMSNVPELLKHVNFEATNARVIYENNTPGTITPYKTPAPDLN